MKSDFVGLEDGFDFIVSEANDFIRGLQSEDFTAPTAAISLKNERFYHG